MIRKAKHQTAFRSRCLANTLGNGIMDEMRLAKNNERIRNHTNVIIIYCF